MTKEELRKEATTTVEWECTPMIDRPTFINGYITGAEPRENRIEELERKLKVETELSDRLGLAYREYEQLIKEQDEHLAELEQEKAELKLKLEALEGQTPWKDIRDKSELIEKLTKATELIEDMYDAIPSSHSDYYKDVMERARQFLSEAEK